MQNLRTALAHKSVIIIPNQNLYDFIIIFRSVWKRTVCAYLDFFSILLYVCLTSGTVWHTIHRTITKQTIKVIRKSLVTRKIFAICVFKVFIRVFHFYSFYIHMLFLQSSLQNADLTDNTGAEIQASNYHGLSRSRSFCLWPAWSQYNRLRYPELYAKELSKNVSMLNAIKKAFRAGMPTVAECGGFMYLHRYYVYMCEDT